MTTLAPMSIGSEITRVRKEKGLKQEELAKLCGIDQRTLSNYENNKNLPSAKRLKLIADVLGQEWRLKDK